jgi:hypothetical protein
VSHHNPESVTLFEVVKIAVAAVDPPGSPALDDFFSRFEDADEPLGGDGAERIAQRIAEEAGKVDPQEEDPVVQDAAAIATYLAFRRDRVGAPPDKLLAAARKAEHLPGG